MYLKGVRREDDGAGGNGEEENSSDLHSCKKLTAIQCCLDSSDETED